MDVTSPPEPWHLAPSQEPAQLAPDAPETAIDLNPQDHSLPAANCRLLAVHKQKVRLRVVLAGVGTSTGAVLRGLGVCHGTAVGSSA